MAWVLATMLSVGCGEEAPVPEPEGPALGLEFVAPVDRAASNGVLGIALRLTGGAPDQVDLFVDDQWLARLDQSNYSWDTRAWPEGEHVLVARARSGTRVFSSAPRQVVVDRTPPRLEEQQPAAGATDVAVGMPLALRFSEPLLPGVVRSAELVVTATGGGTETLRPTGLSEDGRTLQFPRTSLLLGPSRILSARLEGVVSDAADNRVPTGRETSWSWTVPTFLSLGDPLEAFVNEARPVFAWMRPVMRLDAKGDPLLAWFDLVKGVRMGRWTGSRWVALNAGLPPGRLSYIQSLHLDAQGRPTVVGLEQDYHAATSRLAVHRLESGKWVALGAEIFLPSTQEYSLVQTSAVTVTPAGLPRLAWVATSKGSWAAAATLMSQRTPGVWDGGSGLQSRGQMTGSESLLLVQSDTGSSDLAAWSEQFDGKYGIGLRQLRGETWEDVSEAPRFAYRTGLSVALQPGDVPVVAWANRSFSNSSIEVRRRVDGAWNPLGDPLPISLPAEAALAVSTALAVEDSGQPLLAWSRPGQAEVWRWNGSSWAALGVMRQPAASSDVASPLLVSGGGGGRAPVVAWLRPDGTKDPRGILSVYRLNQ